MHFEEITQIKAFSFGDSEKVSERKRQEGGDFEGNFKFRSGSAKRGKRGTTNALRTKLRSFSREKKRFESMGLRTGPSNHDAAPEMGTSSLLFAFEKSEKELG